MLKPRRSNQFSYDEAARGNSDRGRRLVSLEGQRLDVPTVTIGPHDEKVFDVAAWASNFSPQMGSVQVRYLGADRVISGSVKVTRERQSLIFDQQLTEPEEYFKSSRLEGVWWLPSRKAKMSVVLSNTGDTPLSSQLVLVDEQGHKIGSKSISVSAHETKLISANELTETESKLPEIGGLSVSHTGTAGSLFVEGLIQAS